MSDDKPKSKPKPKSKEKVETVVLDGPVEVGPSSGADTTIEISTFEGHAEPTVITAVLDVNLDDAEVIDNDATPSIDDVLAGNTDDDHADDGADDDELAAAVEAHPAGRFPDESVPEHLDAPAASRLPAELPVEHQPVSAVQTDEQRARRTEKESMSRSERRRLGW